MSGSFGQRRAGGRVDDLRGVANRPCDSQPRRPVARTIESVALLVALVRHRQAYSEANRLGEDLTERSQRDVAMCGDR